MRTVLGVLVILFTVGLFIAEAVRERRRFELQQQMSKFSAAVCSLNIAFEALNSEIGEKLLPVMQALSEALSAQADHQPGTHDGALRPVRPRDAARGD